MKVRSAEFIMSNSNVTKAPKERIPEYAFIGRSNVGKSSLINMLMERKDLAKISGKPGKTQLINHFKINEDWFLVDLPGYGYAKVSKKRRTEFKNMIRYYLTKRENLSALFVLVDLRIPPQTIDLEFINDCGIHGIPLVLVGTKSDKLKPEALKENLKAIENALYEAWEELPPFVISSANTKVGRKEILQIIEDAIQLSQQ